MKKIVLILSVCFLVVLGLIIYLRLTATPVFSVEFFNVGQGDAALIKFDDGGKMLVDCGPNRKILSKLGGALSFFDRTIDYLVISHPDLDHYGGCVDVLKRYKIKNIITNSTDKGADPFWQAWQKQLAAEGATIKIINGPEEIIIASSTLDFLAPDSGLGLPAKDTEGNNASVVFKLTHGTKSFLFTGDAETPLENALRQRYCLKAANFCPKLQADVLKVGHHGSDTSSSEEFLAGVNPKEAVVSVGPNKFGHPSFRVLKKLERQGAQILRTDEEGDVMVK